MTDAQKDLMRRLVDALCAAEREFDLIEEYDISVPADIEEALRERDALAATLKFAATLTDRKKLAERYKDELEAARSRMPSSRYSSPRMTVDERVGKELASVHEDVRRADLIGTIPDGIAVPL